jgi:glycosyltransferase involved in cell wall biosynthesis
MASGLPVIATEIAGIPEQVKDGTNEFLIEPGDIEALAMKINRLIDHPALRQRFGTEGEERIKRFSLDAMLSDIDTVYQDLI